jgi:N-acyl-D-aspartate/D-glutamate deacylase
MSRSPAFLRVVAASLLFLFFHPGVSADARVDTLIVGGTLVDGSGATPTVQAIGLRGDRIVHVGTAEGIESDETIDASGLLVMPGFIDPHTHARADLLDPARSDNLHYLTQGVTTLVIGNDGDGSPDVAGTAARLNSHGIGPNVAQFVGHGAVRRAVIGSVNRPATEAEIAAMQGLVRTAMEQGALGLSSGLYYVPGNFAPTDEVVALARTAAAYGGIYDTHLRAEGVSGVGIWAALDEALEIGRLADIHVHLAHLKVLGVDLWGESARVIERVEAARAAGLSVSADQYPWRASGTRLRNAIVPRWALAGSREAFLARLAEVRVGSELDAEMREKLRARGGPQSLLVLAGADPGMTGRTLAEIAGERDPLRVAIELMRAGDTRVASFNMHEDDIRAFMRQAWVMTSSDGSPGHPRKYGSFPRKYRLYVREQGLMSAAEYVRRSAALAAEIFGLGGRGLLREGYFADVAVIDPERFREWATFQQPERPSEGVVHLFVNGKGAIVDGVGTRALSGRVLTPSRDEAGRDHAAST